VRQPASRLQHGLICDRPYFGTSQFKYGPRWDRRSDQRQTYGQHEGQVPLQSQRRSALSLRQGLHPKWNLYRKCVVPGRLTVPVPTPPRTSRQRRYATQIRRPSSALGLGMRRRCQRQARSGRTLHNPVQGQQDGTIHSRLRPSRRGPLPRLPSEVNRGRLRFLYRGRPATIMFKLIT
jgi:hypothetical protein